MWARFIRADAQLYVVFTGLKVVQDNVGLELTHQILPFTLRSTRIGESTVRFVAEKWRLPCAPTIVVEMEFRFSDQNKTAKSIVDWEF